MNLERYEYDQLDELAYRFSSRSTNGVFGFSKNSPSPSTSSKKNNYFTIVPGECQLITW